MLATRLKSLRKEKNITQKKLSDEINVSASTIGLYEQGRRTPDNETLTKIADYFEVTTDYLLGRTNQKYFKEEDTIAFHTKKKITDKDLKHLRSIVDAYIDGLEDK